MNIEASSLSPWPSSYLTPEQSSSRKTGAAERNDKDLNEVQLREIERLKARDKEVRAHEMAHLTASSGLAVSAPSYEMTTGPDGQRYATGGEVRIDTSQGRTPEETTNKAQRIIAAALAPAEPSAQDLQVAAQARQMLVEAQSELAQQRTEENRTRLSGEEPDGSPSFQSRQFLAGYNASAPDPTLSGGFVDIYA